MPCDYSARSSHPFIPYPSHTSRSSAPSFRSYLSRPSSQTINGNASSTSYIQPGRYGSYQSTLQYPGEHISTLPQIRTNDLAPPAHIVPQQTLTTANVISQPSLADARILSLPPPSPPRCPPSPSPPASRPRVTTAGDISSFDSSVAGLLSPHVNPNQPHSSHLVAQSSHLPFSAPQYRDERHLVRQSPQHNASTLPPNIQPYTNMPFISQSTIVYPAPLNHNYPIGTQHHPHTYHPAPWSPQAEQVGTQFTQPCFTSEQISSARQRLPRQQIIGPGTLDGAHDFVMNHPLFIDSSSDNFMASFLNATIIGAEFDSSDPNMPLRCHPGTRLEIIKRCQDFILDREGRPKLRWVVGAAGVGKSAIMQSVAHDESLVLADTIVGATIFFSVNGRQDGTKAINTIAYQLAVKLNPYRLFVQREVTHDPSLLQKSLSTQFKKFIVEPFVHHRLLHHSCRLLIIIDGLDECDKSATQLELLGLISFFCIKYPSSPLLWLVASRPEPHITSFFSQPKVAVSYEKEEILVDSDDAHEDVRRYLHDKFREVQMASITLRRLLQWPSEDDFSTIAEAAGGLFAYASTVVRYISDPNYGDPVGQLDDVLNIIETGAGSNLSGQDHPMAQLDALYARIMSRIPAKVMANTRKLLLLKAVGSGLETESFRDVCNMLGMTENAAYGATHHIYSIARVPMPDEAENQILYFFHKSFPDYLQDFERSGFSPDIWSEAGRLADQCVLRVLEEAPDGVYIDGTDDCELDIGIGILRNHPGTQDCISVSWPASRPDGRKPRLTMFSLAVSMLRYAPYSFRINEEAFRSLPFMHVLTTCFTEIGVYFPLDEVRDFPFEEPRRREFLEHSILKQVLLKTIDYDAIMIRRYIRLRLKGPAANDAWNTSCRHPKKGHSQDWSTGFRHSDAFGLKHRCRYCFKRLINHFKMQLPSHPVTVLGFTAEHRVVEFQFVDPEDGISEWTYRFVMGQDIGLMKYEDDDKDDEYQGYACL